MSGYNTACAALNELALRAQGVDSAEALARMQEAQAHLQEAWEALARLCAEVQEAWEWLGPYDVDCPDWLRPELDQITRKEQRRRADLQAAARFRAINARAAQDRARQILRNRKRLPRYRTKQRRGPTECD